METVTITLVRASVLADMKVKSHAQVATISDDTERYLTELGTEKEQEAHQCITDAFAELQSIMRPFLHLETAASASDIYSTGDLTLEFYVTARKAAGLAQPLADALHKYAVDAALAKFYRAVSRPAFMELHERFLPGDMAAIEGLLYRRTKPTYTR